jgi:hypothetical protein
VVTESFPRGPGEYTTSLSQLFNYHDTGLAKRHIFFRLFAPLITIDEKDRPVDLTGVNLSHYSLKSEDAKTCNTVTRRRY